MALENIYAVVTLAAVAAPWLAYRAKAIGEAILWAAIGTAASWALLTWAGSMQYGVLFWLAGGLFLINVFELAVAMFAPLLRTEEE